MTIADLIEYQSRIEPEKPAIIAGTTIVTFGMLRQVVHSLAARLAERQLPEGSIVALYVAAPARHVALTLALSRVGLVSAPVPSADALALLGGVSLLIADPAAEFGSNLPTITATDDWFIPGPAPETAARPIALEAPARLMFSSGTTGRPRPLVCSARGIETHTGAISFSFDLAPSAQRLLSMMDLVSSWGFFTALSVLSRGGTICFSATAEDALRMIAVYRCDYLVASVFHLRALVEGQRQRFVPLPSLTGISTGGSIVPHELVSAAQATLTQRILVQYGSTEAGPAAYEHVGVPGWDEGSTGFVAPWMEVEVLDGNGLSLPSGQEGEIRLRCEGMKWPMDTPPAPGKRPWFYPGDRGMVSPDGRLRITGRLSELINVGGVKIAPESIDAMLLAYPGIRDAGAVALRDDHGLEQIAAAIVADEVVDLVALAAFCQERDELATPSRFLQVAALPRGVTGKVQRPLLREMFASQS